MYNYSTRICEIEKKSNTGITAESCELAKLFNLSIIDESFSLSSYSIRRRGLGDSFRYFWRIELKRRRKKYCCTFNDFAWFISETFSIRVKFCLWLIQIISEGKRVWHEEGRGKGETREGRMIMHSFDLLGKARQGDWMRNVKHTRSID